MKHIYHRSKIERYFRSLYWLLTDQIRAMPYDLLLFLLLTGSAWMVALTVALWGVMF